MGSYHCYARMIARVMPDGATAAGQVLSSSILIISVLLLSQGQTVVGMALVK